MRGFAAVVLLVGVLLVLSLAFAFSEYSLPPQNTVAQNALTCGDVNGNGNVGLSDVIYLVNYIFSKPGCSPLPGCWIAGYPDVSAANVDGQGSVSLGDAVSLVNFIFSKPGWPPCATNDSNCWRRCPFQQIDPDFSSVAGCETDMQPFMFSFPPHNASIEYNLKNVSQYTNQSRSNNSCSPASSTAAAEYLNRTGAIKNMSTLNATFEELSKLMNTTANGTVVSEEINGWLKYLVNHSANVTVKFYMNISGSNAAGANASGQAITNGSNVAFELITRRPTITDVIFEMSNQEVITMGLKNSSRGWKHTMAVDDINTAADANGCHEISFMDPEGPPPGGRKVFAKACGSQVVFQNGFIATIYEMIATSPKT